MNSWVEKEIQGTLGILKINKPKFNVLTFEFLDKLLWRFNQLVWDKEVQAIAIIGTGRVFSAGFDLKEIIQLAESKDDKLAREKIWKTHEVLLRISKCDKPTIAVINGLCFGGGLELALACQYRVIVEPNWLSRLQLWWAGVKNPLALPEIDLGLIPGLGGTQRLPRLVGYENAQKILMAGMDGVSIAEARRIGLVDQVVNNRELANGVVHGFVKTVLSGQYVRQAESGGRVPEEFLWPKGRPGIAASSILHLIELRPDTRLEDGLKLEMGEFINCLFSEDAQEGVRAFLEHREPNFQVVTS